MATKEFKIENVENITRLNESGTVSKSKLTTALDAVVAQVEANMPVFETQFPSPATVNNHYQVGENREWTPGFWTGMLWLAYEYTGQAKFKELALQNVQSFEERIDNNVDVDNHDLGFMYLPSCVNAYHLTDDPSARRAALKAADKLMTRFQPKGNFIQAWGKKGADDNYRLIIDALLNIPLLYWASDQTGDPKYQRVAGLHYKTAVSTVFRQDGSTYHTYFFDPQTGQPLYGATHQGYSDDSCWARGQAWGIYGTALHYYVTKDSATVPVFESVTNYFLNRLPRDAVPFWDMIFTDGDDQVRDSSSAAIAICGIEEMLRLLPKTNRYYEIYQGAAHKMLNSLIDSYTLPEINSNQPLLKHGVYSWHSGKGVDEGNLWGDYFYFEALMRTYRDWKLYW
ncbi:glucuronyl hydrolase [Lactiplantibacillus garii]|uniref:Glucuronyl hydrolase n=1 Tax=Lactiplantibacillus garii TaxID=2306423 RepID=A0A3R8QPH8_9LACO|nr:glycoside hydrolase family 88 protein [Lactiplantibacillus garii]RRK09470.1 glucuronyl hydrolase [Lactiplantibacillus garii]